MQILYTWPRRQELVLDFLANTTLSMSHVATFYMTLGAIFTFHTFVQGKVLEIHGAQALGIVNAMRSSVILVVSGVMFCSPTNPLACLTLTSVASALTVSAGVLMWTLAPKAAAKAVSAEEEPGKTAPDKKEE
eukprot:gene10185-8093_t